MDAKPTSLTGGILYNLAIMAVSKDADAETKATHRVLRTKFSMNPDIYQRGDAA